MFTRRRIRELREKISPDIFEKAIDFSKNLIELSNNKKKYLSDLSNIKVRSVYRGKFFNYVKAFESHDFTALTDITTFESYSLRLRIIIGNFSIISEIKKHFLELDKIECSKVFLVRKNCRKNF